VFISEIYHKIILHVTRDCPLVIHLWLNVVHMNIISKFFLMWCSLVDCH